MNGDFCLEFLRGYIDCPKSENKLDKSLYTTMCANEFKAGLRANVLWKYNRTSVGHRSDTDRTVPDTDRIVPRASLCPVRDRTFRTFRTFRPAQGHSSVKACPTAL